MILSKRKSMIFWVLKKVTMDNNNTEILEEFIYSILKDTKSLESDISQLVDEYFWHLIE